jgi:RNA polymerase sigma factor (sigma-70 family)
MLKLANPIGSKARCNHEEVFVRHYDRLLERALRLTQGDRESAEDLVQEAFVQFTFTRPDLDSIEFLEGYLYGMVRNLHLMDLRRATHRRNEPLALVDFDSLDLGLRSRDLSQAIQTKNELGLICTYACQRKRTSKAGSVLILRFFHGYYPSEIAQIIQSSRPVVSELLTVARTEARRFTEDPGSLVFLGDSKQPHSVSVQAGLSYVHILSEIRSSIFRSRTGQCLSDVELESIYQTSRPAPVDCTVLDHLVSCVECLDSVNKMLKLPLLADRNPADMLSPNKSARRKDSDGPGNTDGPDGPDDTDGSGDGGSHLEEIRQKCRRRARRVFEHEPRELCVSVNGDRQFWQRIGSECSEQTFSLEETDTVEVIEVSSEQGIRLLLLQVDQRVDQTAQVELSEGRTLRVSLDQSSPRPRLKVSYVDPSYASEIHSSRDLEKASSTLEGTKGGWLHKLRRFLQSSGKPLLRPQVITAIVVLLVVAGLVMYRFSGPSLNRSILLATELLERSAFAEHSFLARTDTVLHRSIKVERKELIGKSAGQVTQHRIEIWHSTEKGLTARRLFDRNEQLIAGLWQRKDGVEIVYHHGKAPELKLASKDRRQPISAANFWFDEPTADNFRRIIGNSEALKVEELASTYLVSYAPQQPSNTQIVKASLVLAKADLHVTEMTLVTREDDPTSSQALMFEYHFTEASFERHSPSTVSESTFEPEGELLGSDNSLIKPANPVISAAPVPEPAPRVRATADLEVEVLRLLHEAGADLGEQVVVTKTREGFLRVSGVVETEQRRTEILSRLRPVIDSHVAIVEIETVAKALARQTASQPTDVESVADSVTTSAAATMPVEDDLRKYFSKEGDRTDEAVRQFAMRMVTRSRKSMVHIYAIKRLLRQFSASEFGELSVDARVKWLGLLESHARAFKAENDLMRSELRPVFFADQNFNNNEQATSLDVASAIATAEQLITIATANDRVVRYSFNTRSETVPQQTVKSREFWSSMEQASRLTVLIAGGGL